MVERCRSSIYAAHGWGLCRFRVQVVDEHQHVPCRELGDLPTHEMLIHTKINLFAPAVRLICDSPGQFSALYATHNSWRCSGLTALGTLHEQVGNCLTFVILNVLSSSTLC